MFWEKKMEEQLVSFYHDTLLPEIIDPRLCRNMPLRENKNTKKNSK